MNNKNNKGFGSNIIIFVFLVMLNYILSTPGMLKYVISFGILLIFSIKNKVNYISKIKFFTPNIIYIVLGLFLCLINYHFSSYILKTSLLLIIPFVFSVIISSIFKKNINSLINMQFLALLFLYTVIERFPGESQYAFTFGLFVIFFICKKDFSKKYRFISVILLLILMLVFTGKRLAALLSILSIFLIVFFNKFKFNSIKKGKMILTILCILSLAYIYACGNGLFDLIKMRYGVLVSGREYLYNLFSNYYSFNPLYFGKGIGWTFEKISSFNIRGAGNLHNDLLMTYIDLGFFGYIFWLMSFSKWFSTNNKKGKLCIPIIVIIIYTIGNYMTDNIMIYINYWLTAYLMLFSFYEDNDNNYINKEKDYEI